MRIILALALVLASMSAAANTHRFEYIAQDVHSLYTKIKQDGADPLVWHTGLEPFAGDCDDYVTAMMARLDAEGLDYQVYLVQAYRRGSDISVARRATPHVVICHGEVCADSERHRPWRFKGASNYKRWVPARLVRES